MLLMNQLFSGACLYSRMQAKIAAPAWGHIFMPEERK